MYSDSEAKIELYSYSETKMYSEFFQVQEKCIPIPNI